MNPEYARIIIEIDQLAQELEIARARHKQAVRDAAWAGLPIRVLARVARVSHVTVYHWRDQPSK